MGDPTSGYATTCGEYGVCDPGPEYDMLEWMRQTYSGNGSTHLEQGASGSNNVISEFSSCDFSSGFYRVNFLCGQGHEKFVHDSSNIFIVREVFQDSLTHFKTHANFVWLRRYMHSGDSFFTDCSWKEYTTCSSYTAASCSAMVSLSGPVSLSLGGDLGTVQALVRNQLLGNGMTEKYFYAKPYGFVKFELRDSNGNLVRQEIFNEIVSGNPKPHTSACYSLECTGQSGSCQ